MRRFWAALRTSIYGSGFTLFWIWVGLRLRTFDRQLEIRLPGWFLPLAVVLGASGLALTLACAVAFAVCGNGTPAPFDAPRTLVVAGPYRYVRNPMYLGALVALAGFGLWLRSVSILALPFALLCLMHLFVIYYEEPTLTKKFGVSYREYCQQVPRWLPRWKSQKL